jgi:hypothetical protein
MNFLLSKNTARAVCLSLLLPLVMLSGCGDGPRNPDTAAGAGTGVNGLGQGPSPVTLGSAANYVILAQSAITDVPTSAITGNVGLSPGTGAGIGLACPEVTGAIQTVDAAGPACRTVAPSTLTTAINDKGTAYTDAAGRAPDYTELAAGLIGGLNLSPATYKWSSAVSITSELTLTGGPNDVWIFQIAQGLSVSSGVRVTLAGGALAQKVYWQVFSAADLGSTSAFKGTIISQTSVVLKTGATLNGRALAGTAVTLQSNVVSP